MKNLFYLGLIMYLFVSINTCYSENPNWVYYNNYNSINCLAQDSNNLWIGTSGGGIVKYNKETEEKTVYNKSNSIVEFSISALHLDIHNNLWILNKALVGSIPQLIKYDGNEFIKINMDSIISKLNYNLTLCSDEDGRIWIPLKTGVARFDGVEWTIFDSSATGIIFNNITDMKYKNNTLWIVQNKQVIKYDGETWNHSTLLENYSASFKKFDVDNENNLWIGAKEDYPFGLEANIIKFDSKENIFYKIHNSRCEDSDYFNSLSIDSSNNLWYSVGDYLYKGKDTSFTSISQASEGIADIKHDNNGVSWLGFKRIGLHKYLNNEITTKELSVFSILGTSYQTILPSKNKGIWLGKVGALYQINGKNWKSLDINFKEFKGNSIDRIQEAPDGSIWISVSGSSLLQIKDEERMIYSIHHYGMNNSMFRKFIFEENNKIWYVGSSPNLYLFDGNSWKQFDNTHSDYLEKTIYDIARDSKGNIWIGNNHLIMYDGSEFFLKDSGDSLSKDLNVYRIAITKNDIIYLLTLNKLIKIENDLWSSIEIPGVDMSKGISSDLHIDKYNNLWICIRGIGVGKYDGKNWEIFNTENSGLSDNAITTFTIDHYNNKWFGTQYSGIAVFNEEGVVTGVEEEQVVKENVKSLSYPNPASNQITININSDTFSKYKIEIYNLLGIKQTELYFDLDTGENSIPIDVSSLSIGVYFVVFNDGNIIKNNLFVKE